MPSSNLIRFLPTYVGSKAYWVERLERFKGSDFVELFCGSAVLSANLAKTAVLNDLDPKIYQILKNYDQLIVPEVFTKEDFFNYRKNPDWHLYVYPLQKLAFSGVFRYSKNGYNTPIKKKSEEVRCQSDYLRAKERWLELKPTVLNKDYTKIPVSLMENKVVVLDPPYEASQAAYNASSFDYDRYWQCIDILKKIAKTLIVFDRQENLQKQDIPVVETRKMRVNGSKQGGVEALAIFENNMWLRKI